MTKFHPANERVKRRYLTFLEDAKRMAPRSTDHVAAAIAQFENYTGGRDFARFHIEQARGFKRKLNEAVNPDTRNPFSKATVHSRLMAMKAFVEWLAGQPGYKSRIKYSDAEYFNPSANDGRIVGARRDRPAPSLDQIKCTIGLMPANSDIEKRNRALIAFAILSGMRDDALASLSIRHVNLDARKVFQDARMVRTKNRKTFTSYFFPVGDEIEAIVCDWIHFLMRDKQFTPDDPLFPATEISLNAESQFSPSGLKQAYWQTADPIRSIFRKAFEAAGLPYFNPHSFRKTLALLGEKVCTNPEAFKAWSQNLGHEQVLTTFISYGTISDRRQAEIFSRFDKEASKAGEGDAPDATMVKRVVEHLVRRSSLA